jgi:hypothetical protein
MALNISRVPASSAMLQPLMELDEKSFDDPWDELKWRGLLALQEKKDSAVAVVVAVERLGPGQCRIHGFSAWSLQSGEVTQAKLLKVAVSKGSRRHRLGMQLVNVPWQQDTDCEATVHERSLRSQKFFRGCGWVGKPVGKLDGEGSICFRTQFRKEKNDS